MSLWRLLGGEINYERIRKQRAKQHQRLIREREEEIRHKNQILRIHYKAWKKSIRPLEERIKLALELWGEEEFKEFLKRYPNLVSDDLNPFLNQKEPKVEKVIDEKEELNKIIEYQAELIKKLEQQNSSNKKQ